MDILNIRTIDGPNVFTHEPVVIMTLDLEDLHERETREFPGLNERLLALLPGLREHTCGLGYPGGFVERLNGGTYFGHVIEHATIEIGHQVDATGNYGKTVRSARPHAFDIVVSSRVHAATTCLLRSVTAGIAGLVRGGAWAVEPLVEEARRVVARAGLGPSTRAIVDAALRRGIPAVRLNDESLVQLGYGARRRLVESTMSDATSGIAVELAQDKALTKEILARAFIPVPFGRTVTTLDEAVAVFDEIGGEAVVKPLDGNQGRGVTVGISTPQALADAFSRAQRHSARVIVEEAFAGEDYRLLVIGGKLVAASRRAAPCVTGDGTHTIAELVAAANQDPRRGEGHEKPLTKIRIDDVALAALEKQALRPEDVPAAGRAVALRDSANLSTGGTATDVTDDVHPDVQALCERAARVVGLDICGVDLITPDISRPLPRAAGIVELNAGPGIRMHVHPSRGTPRDAGASIVAMLYPDPADNGRIPLIAITGTNGKTTVTRMIAHAFGHAGFHVGMTTTDGVWIGGRAVARGDMTGPRSARVVLSDPAVEIAVLETARGGIVRSGLGYDWSDVGVITNIQLDHVGQDGIATLDDIAHIKSLVAERVKEGGTLVFNADDPGVMRLLDERRIAKLKRDVRLFSMFPNHFQVRRHVSNGGIAYVPRNGWVLELSRGSQRPIASIAAIPAVLGGAAQFQLANAMAAIAACRAQGLAPEAIAEALETFGAHEHNRGRGNLYAVGGGYVLVDYGHNPAAIEAVGRMAARWVGRRLTAVLGLPGDRADSLLEDAARVAARLFERIIVREDRDLRGRAHGELARMLCQAIAAHDGARECRTVLDEAAALRIAIDTMAPNEVIVHFYEDLDLVHEVLADRGAAPARGIDPMRVAEDGTFRVLRRA